MFCSPTVSHTLPASGLHPRPPLETNAGHKSLKRYSSAGADAVHLPPPDYAGDLENKPGANHLLSVDTLDLSGSLQLYSWYMLVIVDSVSWSVPDEILINKTIYFQKSFLKL